MVTMSSHLYTQVMRSKTLKQKFANVLDNPKSSSLKLNVSQYIIKWKHDTKTKHKAFKFSLKSAKR